MHSESTNLGDRATWKTKGRCPVASLVSCKNQRRKGLRILSQVEEEKGENNNQFIQLIIPVNRIPHQRQQQGFKEVSVTSNAKK